MGRAKANLSVASKLRVSGFGVDVDLTKYEQAEDYVSFYDLFNDFPVEQKQEYRRLTIALADYFASIEINCPKFLDIDQQIKAFPLTPNQDAQQAVKLFLSAENSYVKPSNEKYDSRVKQLSADVLNQFKPSRPELINDVKAQEIEIENVRLDMDEPDRQQAEELLLRIYNFSEIREPFGNDATSSAAGRNLAKLSARLALQEIGAPTQANLLSFVEEQKFIADRLNSLYADYIIDSSQSQLIN